jgi:GH15 family glucan-1,4-alpha-glucosidase
VDDRGRRRPLALGPTVTDHYGIAGERDLTERELDHLSGWRGSRPVRIGNAAWKQRQSDIFGEFLNAFSLYAEKMGRTDEAVSHFLSDVADSAAEHWKEPDAGMWEMRAEPRHHVTSKVLCWVALDRAVRLAPQIGAEDRVEEWTDERERVRQAILDFSLDVDGRIYEDLVWIYRTPLPES